MIKKILEILARWVAGSPFLRKLLMTLKYLSNQIQDYNKKIPSQNVMIEKEFSPETFKQIPQDTPTLIICDCEGYESVLFSEPTVAYLSNTTLLIETHDFLNPEISVRLEQLLTSSHSIQFIQSVDDILKAKYYTYKELEGLSLARRRELVKEMRPAIMEWIVAVPK